MYAALLRRLLPCSRALATIFEMAFKIILNFSVNWCMGQGILPRKGFFLRTRYVNIPYRASNRHPKFQSLLFALLQKAKQLSTGTAV